MVKDSIMDYAVTDRRIVIFLAVLLWALVMLFIH